MGLTANLKKMKIKVLVDNTPGEKCQGAHGLSLWVEADLKVLLDLGPSDLFLKNATFMGVDVNQADAIVLSHGHWDHGNGLLHIQGKPLVTHPSAFVPRYRKRDFSPIGLPLDRAEASSKFKLQESKQPYWLSPQMVFLGEIPRNNDFEAQTTPFCYKDGTDDFVPDDSALVVVLPQGLVVISGCAHAGICNTVDYARRVCGDNRVLAVMGGFHLKKIDQTTHKVMNWLKDTGVEHVMPFHCTSHEVIEQFNDLFGDEAVFCGTSLEF